MLELAGSVPLSDEQAHILTAAFLRCEELTAKKYLVFVPMNRELAAKYGTCERTVRYWRREGCPFAKGGNGMCSSGWRGVATFRRAPRRSSGGNWRN